MAACTRQQEQGGQKQQRVLFLGPSEDGEQQKGVWEGGVRVMPLARSRVCVGPGRSEGLVWGFLIEVTFP